MKFPRPSVRAYVEFVATVLTTFVVLQYAGVFFANPGALDVEFLGVTAVLLPVQVYVMTVVFENVGWLPQWDRMVRQTG
jgi:hypothetical protein